MRYMRPVFSPRQTMIGAERQCEEFLDTLKKKGIEGYRKFCVELDTSQPFIKRRLDATASDDGHSDRIYVNKYKLEAQHKRELDVKDGQLADLRTEIKELQVQTEQKDKAHAELNGKNKTERAEFISEVEALKTKLSKAEADLQQSKAGCEVLQKRLQEEQDAYDALVGVPRTQSPERVGKTEHVQHTGSGDGVCQFSTESCCDEHQPCLLPCLHSACKPCLDQQAAEAEGKCMYCPSCGRGFTMEQITVDHVRCNEAAYNINAHGERKCGYIVGYHDATAVKYCHECKEPLCSGCYELHGKPKQNQNHRVLDIKQPMSVSMPQRLSNCRDHFCQNVLYDYTCNKAICDVCMRGAHKDHNTEELNQAYDEANGQLEEQVKKQQLILEDVTGRIGRATSHQTELVNTQRKLEKDATAVCKGIGVKFLHRQRQLVEAVQESFQAQNEMLQKQFDTLHDVHTSIVSTIDYIKRTLESTSQEELITLNDVLHMKCEEHLKRELPEDNTPDTKIILTFQGQRALEDLIDKFGGLVSCSDVGEIPDTHPTFQGNEGRWHQLGKVIHAITGYSGTMHIISGKRGSRFITCPNIQLDGARANQDRCHVTAHGELVNTPLATQHADSGRLQTLSGTCSSTPIPLPPSTSSVTPVSHTHRYWETHTWVGVVDDVSPWPVMEMGVGEESQVDSEYRVCKQGRSWCISVRRCDIHKRDLCTRLSQAGEEGKSDRKAMSDAPGTQATLHYGVVVDVRRGRIGFIDVGRSVVLGKVDAKFKEDLLPVFAVCPSDDHTIHMKVVSGEEILMSDTKKSLIDEALS